MSTRSEDTQLDKVVDSLLVFLPLFYRKIYQAAHARARINPGNLQFHTLAMIMRMGTLQTSEISRRLGISKPNTTALLDKLIEWGYIQRVNDTRDKRVKRIAITDKGRRFVLGRKRIMRGEIKRSLSSLDVHELVSLSGALETFTDIVSRVDYGS